MPDLALSLDYFDHPKTRCLVRLLGKGAAELPLRLWTYAGKYHKADGRLTGYTPEQIEAELGWRGQPGKAVEALLDCGKPYGKLGYLEVAEDGFQVHEWEEHQGHLEHYHQAAKENAKKRWEEHRKRETANRNANRNANGTAKGNAPARLGYVDTPLTPPDGGAGQGVPLRPSEKRRRAKVTVGSQDPPGATPMRSSDDPGAPEWVRSIAARIDADEPLSSEEFSAYTAWCAGEDVGEPARAARQGAA